MVSPTWGELLQKFCTIQKDNPYYEEFANRRYNYAASIDHQSCRLVFLKDVLKDRQNKTLRRKGRFVWCRNLKYEGRNSDGLRAVSFTVDKGSKRFYVGENNILCLPSQICVQNNRYFKPKGKTFFPFSSVFSYENSFKMMVKNSQLSFEDFSELLRQDNPYRPGSLVAPRKGYFCPEINTDKLNKEITQAQQHPCGIILGASNLENKYVTREFYRVRFGNKTYERVHPVQMEILNEV